jgi:hypothetical protein
MSSTWPTPGRCLEDFDGDWNRYIEACYQQYRDDFYSGRPRPWPIGAHRT